MGINSVVDEATFIAYARTVCGATINNNKVIVTYSDGIQVELQRNQTRQYYREAAKLLY